MSNLYRKPQYADLEWVVMRQRHRQHTSMPRFTPVDWWECDICEITQSGYFREFEIKMSRRDFKIDANKSREIRSPEFPFKVISTESKHTLLKEKDVRGPSEFYYVTPVGLISKEEVPAWAGLIHVGIGAYRPYEIMVKRAQKLHSNKANPQIKESIEKCCYWRFHHMIDNNYHRWKSKLTPKPPQSTDEE